MVVTWELSETQKIRWKVISNQTRFSLILPICWVLLKPESVLWERNFKKNKQTHKGIFWRQIPQFRLVILPQLATDRAAFLRQPNLAVIMVRGGVNCMDRIYPRCPIPGVLCCCAGPFWCELYLSVRDFILVWSFFKNTHTHLDSYTTLHTDYICYNNSWTRIDSARC